MKRFRFSLQKVLDMRDFEKRQAQADLGKALAVERQIQNTLDLIAESRAQSVRSADSMHDIKSLYGVGLYFQLLEQRKETALEELARAKVVTNAKREVMLSAMQRVKALENLKDRRRIEWKRAQLKAEDDEIDDIVTSHFNREG